MNEKFLIDDITWNDLNMDDVYDRLNCAKSSVGREFLKDCLKTPLFEAAPLLKRNEITEYLQSEKAVRERLSKIFSDLGVTKKVSFRDYIFKLNEVEARNNFKHVILIILLLLSVAAIFIRPVIGIVALVVMFIINIATYFSDKAKIEGYFICLKYLVSMVIAAGKISSLDLSETPLSDHSEALRRLYKTFASVKRGSWLITNSVSGSLVDVIMDYVRMLFHVDLIKFNTMRKTALDHSEEIDELYNTLGEIETCSCVAVFRESLNKFCLPEFSSDTSVSFENIYHPLLEKPVYNSLRAEKAVLLTGSNASGKSTFLKSVAINQIFAQTIFTCLADGFHTGFFKVLSSMALSDNILNNESYFIVEIKSLKRVFDSLGKTPVMCFVDEVLRGTNTKERIAASSTILEDLSKENAVVFAATHDIELTKLLEGSMANYHFTETVEDNEVKFDYLVKEGPSTSRNAIKLLAMYGFPSELVSKAESLT